MRKRPLATRASAPPSASPPLLGAPRAQLLAWAAVAAIDAAAITLDVPLRATTPRALHLFYDAGQTLAAGVASAAALTVSERLWRRHPAAGLTLLAAVAIGAGLVILRDDLDPFAQRVAAGRLGGLTHAWEIALAVAVALAVPAAASLGMALDRPRRRLAGVALGVAAAIANHLVLCASYPSAHVFLVWAGCACAGASLAGARLPRAAAPLERAARATIAACAVWAAATVVIAPSGG